MEPIYYIEYCSRGFESEFLIYYFEDPQKMKQFIDLQKSKIKESSIGWIKKVSHGKAFRNAAYHSVINGDEWMENYLRSKELNNINENKEVE